MTDGNTIRSVAKAMELLQLLSDAGEAMTLSAISERATRRLRVGAFVDTRVPVKPDVAFLTLESSGQKPQGRNSRQSQISVRQKPAAGRETAVRSR